MDTYILFCPVCCSPVDAVGGQQEHHCGQCGQTFIAQISPDRMAAHSAA
jgi:hypothetical protein